jgi:hypothetical protein
MNIIIFFGRTSIMLLLLALAAVATVSIATGTAVAQQNQTSDSATPARSNNTTTAANVTSPAGMSLDAARDLYLSVWNQTEFNATFSTYVKQFTAAGYGVYEEHGDVFMPGETMVLYVEPVGFGHEELLDKEGNKLYLVNITADSIIAYANGTELQRIEDTYAKSLISHRPNTELSLEVTLTQERPFPEGDYTITYVITDEVSGESFELAKEVRVAKTASASVA